MYAFGAGNIPRSVSSAHVRICVDRALVSPTWRVEPSATAILYDGIPSDLTLTVANSYIQEDTLSEVAKKAGGFALGAIIGKGGSKFGGLDIKRVYFG